MTIYLRIKSPWTYHSLFISNICFIIKNTPLCNLNNLLPASYHLALYLKLIIQLLSFFYSFITNVLAALQLSRSYPLANRSLSLLSSLSLHLLIHTPHWSFSLTKSRSSISRVFTSPLSRFFIVLRICMHPVCPDVIDITDRVPSYKLSDCDYVQAT